MGKKSSHSDYIDFTETKNWNVAQGYAQLKIMRILYELDLYETIATFGTVDMSEEFMIPEEMKVLQRISSIKRFRKILQMLINNTRFAIKKEDKETFDKFLTTLEEIKKILPAIERTTFNQRDKKREISINELTFEKILDILIDIKAKINEPLNKADLIFTSVEEFDPDKLKAELMEDMIHSG